MEAAQERIASCTYDPHIRRGGRRQERGCGLRQVDTGEAPPQIEGILHSFAVRFDTMSLTPSRPSQRGSFVDIGSWQLRRRSSAGVSSLNLIPKSAPAHFALSQKLVRDKAHRVYWMANPIPGLLLAAPMKGVF